MGGDEVADEAFLAELLVTFYFEAIPHVQRLLAVALAYRADPNHQFRWLEGKKPDPNTRSVERVLKEEAHALKGSAANLRLYRLAKAAENVEMPAKKLMLDMEEPSSAAFANPEVAAAARHAALDLLCVRPCEEIKRLVSEFRDFAVFMSGDGFRSKFSPGFDLQSELPPEQLEQLRSIDLAAFDDSVVRKFQDFWLEGEPLPGNIGVGKGVLGLPQKQDAQPQQQKQQQPSTTANAATSTLNCPHQLPDLGSQDSSAPLTGSAAAAAAAPGDALSSSAPSSTTAAPAQPIAVAAAPAPAPLLQSSSVPPSSAPPATAPAPTMPPAIAAPSPRGGKSCCVVQ